MPDNRPLCKDRNASCDALNLSIELNSHKFFKNLYVQMLKINYYIEKQFKYYLLSKNYYLVGIILNYHLMKSRHGKKQPLSWLGDNSNHILNDDYPSTIVETRRVMLWIFLLQACHPLNIQPNIFSRIWFKTKRNYNRLLL